MPRTSNDNHLDSKKNLLRKKAETQLAAKSPGSRVSAAASAAENLKGNSFWRESRTILGYLSFGPELSADKLLREALADDKAVFVPKVFGKQMNFHQIFSLEENFSTGVFGIREPAEDSPMWDLKSSPGPVLVLVPGLAFTIYGARLGRGGGYYDRFINRIRVEASKARIQAPTCIGFAYQDQIFDSVPTSDHDEILDGLVTDAYSGEFG